MDRTSCEEISCHFLRLYQLKTVPGTLKRCFAKNTSIYIYNIKVYAFTPKVNKDITENKDSLKIPHNG